tara:strand:- start:1508 stop:2437 length:930 start_codon:yes stop_codon:yes gene_type:complete
MILITGSTGYIGSHLSQFFLKKKIQYIGIDNLSYSYKNNVTDTKNHYFFNISNKKKVENLIKKHNIKTIIHTAASSYVLEAEKRKKAYFVNNVIKTKGFINICKKNNVKRFIFLSSSNVYKEPKKNKIFKISDKTLPKNYYGKTKLIVEKYLKKKGFDSLIILRLFNVVGINNSNFKIFKFKRSNYQRLIFKLNQNNKLNKITKINYFMKNGKKIYPSRDFVNISDFLQVIIKLLKNNLLKQRVRIFNVSSGVSTPINKIVLKLNKKIKKNYRIKYIKISKKELGYTKGSNKELYKYIKFVPKKRLNIN